MYCQKCGTQLNENDKFCSACGNPTEEVKNKGLNEKKESKFMLPFVLVCILCIVLLGTIVTGLVLFGGMQDKLDTMSTEMEEEEDIEEIQDLVLSVFEDRSSSVRGNEDLGSVCLNYVCEKMIDTGNEVSEQKLGFDLNSGLLSDLEDSLYSNLIIYFENEDNYNKVSSAITAQSTIVCDNIEFDGDEAYAYVTVNHIDVDEVCLMSWQDLFGTDTAVDALLSGGGGIISQLAKLKEGDLSLILDGFAENCSIVSDDCTYTNKVTLEQNEDGEWEIVDFPIQLLYAYYGVSMVSVE